MGFFNKQDVKYLFDNTELDKTYENINNNIFIQIYSNLFKFIHFTYEKIFYCFFFILLRIE